MNRTVTDDAKANFLAKRRAFQTHGYLHPEEYQQTIALRTTVKVETMNLEEQLQVAVACFTPLTFVSEAYDVQSLEALVAPLRAERDRNRNEIEAREQELQRCAF